MFKNLKKKLEQGVAQSKAAVSGLAAAAKGDEKSASTESIGKPVAESTPQRNGSNTDRLEKTSESGSNVAVGQLVDIPLFETTDSTSYETASDMSSLQGNETPKGGRSRTSSISSMTSDSSFFPSVSFSHSYYMPSDVESEIEETSVNLSSVTKEDLYAFVKRFERRAFKYKSKFMELAVAYKDMLQEREKLKSTMAQCQDRAFRRMSELREQIQLDQLAKRDLEDNYRLLLDEKDEYMKVLNMQIKLLKEGKEIPEELQTKLTISQAKADAPPPSSCREINTNISQNDEIELLKSKIKRQDGLLHKCKETITTYKERVTQLSHDKQELLGKLELTSSKSGSTNNSDQLAKLQNQIQEAKKVIEQLESDREVAIASVKQQVHGEMEKRDAELEQMKIQNQKLLIENNNIKIELEKLGNQVDVLTKTNKEQLDKAREIMKKLKDDKLHAVEQAEERIRIAEQNMEEEKEKMLTDLKRGKAEAFSVLQQEAEKTMLEKLTKALDERDSLWNEKMAAQAEAHNNVIFSKEREKELTISTMQTELRQKLIEKEEELRLAVEERELQKMAAVSGLDEQKDELLRRIEELNSEKIELSNRLSKFQEDSEQKILELQSTLKKITEEYDKKVEDLTIQQKKTLEEDKVKLNQSFQEDLEAVKLNHATEIETLTERLKHNLQDLNSENEILYKSQIEKLTSEMDNNMSLLRFQNDELKNTLTQNQTKLSDTEQLLVSAQNEIELYAAIDGKGEENDTLRQQLEDLNTQLRLKQQDDNMFLKVQEENILLKNEVDATTKLIAEKEDLLNLMKTKERELLGEKINLEESVIELSGQSQILSQELAAIREDLVVTQFKLNMSQNDCHRMAVEYQKKMSELELTCINTDRLRQYEERVKLFEEEHQQLVKTAISDKKQIEELKKLLDELTINASVEKEALESRCKALETQVYQLQDIIRSLETCQNVVETEKSNLEEKLINLEDIMEDLKRSKEELNEKLHESHQTLVEKAAVEKQNLEAAASELATQINAQKDEIEELNKVLVSKNDENIVLRSVMDDNMSYIKSLEQKTEELTSDLQNKLQSEEKLTKTLEKLKAEANAKVKGLKEMKDSLTEQLQVKVKEFEEFTTTSREEKEKLVTSCEEKLNSFKDEMKCLEESFKEQFEQKQLKYKETLNKLKERYEEKLRDKDTQFEEQIRNITSQKDVGIKDMHITFEKLKEEQIRELQLGHESAIIELRTEWELKYQNLLEDHRQKMKDVSAEHQDMVSQLQSKLTQFESLSKDLQEKLGTTQSQLQDLQEKYVSEQTLSAQYKTDLDASKDEFLDKESEFHKLQTQLQSELHIKENKILSFEEQLQEKESKLHLMASTVSSEQEYLQKQLILKTEQLEELNSLLKEKSKQLEDVQEKHRQELEERDASIIETNQKLSQLHLENSSIEEMMKAINDKLQDREEALRNADEKFEDFSKDKDIQIKDLTSLSEQKSDSINTLNLHLLQKDQELLKIKEQKSLDLEELKKTYEEQLIVFSAQESEWQHKISTLEKQLSELHEKCNETESKHNDKLMEAQNLETSLKEHISFLKQQLEESKRLAELSSNELQTDLQQKVTESEGKLYAQLQTHQQELHSARQEAEQSKKDLKQKYVVKLKEFQSQAKSTIDELEEKLRLEKTAKDDIHSELTRANTRLLQLEETSGLSHDTIVDLENKVKELDELVINMKESERNLQGSLNETHQTYQQIKEELILSQNVLKDKENELQKLNLLILEQNEFLNNNKAAIADIEKLVASLKEENLATKEKLELEINAKNELVFKLKSEMTEVNNKCIKFELELEEKMKLLGDLEKDMTVKNDQCKQLESLLDKTSTLLHQAQNSCLELENKVQATSKAQIELENLKSEQPQIVFKVSQLEEERDRLLKKLQDAQLQCEKYKSEINCIRGELSQAFVAKDEFEIKMSALQSSHSKELSEITLKMESQSSTKVAEYKKKAEAYISQVKKQLQDEKNVSIGQLQEVITRLEQDLTSSRSEVSSLQLARDKLVADHTKEVHDVKQQLEEILKSKEELIQEIAKNEEGFHEKELALLDKINDFEMDKILLLQKIAGLEQESKDLELQNSKEFSDLKSQCLDLEKQLDSLKLEKKSELTALEKLMCEKLEESEKNHLASLNEQAGEHSSKLKQLLKDFNQQLSEKEREFEATFHEAIEKSQRGEQVLFKEHQEDLDELRKELLERDERLQELHVEYQSKLESLEFEKSQSIKQLESELSLLKQTNDKNVNDLELKLKSDFQRNIQTRETIHLEEVNALTKEWDFERKMGMQHRIVDEKQHKMSEELTQQNQDALIAFQNSMSGNTKSLQEQVISLTKQLEQLKQKHKLEIAEAFSGIEMKQESLTKPLLAAPLEHCDEASHQDMSLDLQELELQNMDLQAQVYHLNGELSQLKIKERDLIKKMEKMEKIAKGITDDDDPPISLDGSYSNHDDSALFREPTEFEYLKNILYEYMMGRETKTLTKVIATVVRFSEEQTKNVLTKADSRLI